MNWVNLNIKDMGVNMRIRFATKIILISVITSMMIMIAIGIVSGYKNIRRVEDGVYEKMREANAFVVGVNKFNTVDDILENLHKQTVEQFEYLNQ